jgi:asparagine synthase (glutamine-hydrolysing)
MCGIGGYIGDDPTLLGKINTALAHRGPDFAGEYHHNRVHLGHRLLSIRESADLSRQPFQKKDSPWVLVFNGQIYNTRSLARVHHIPFSDLDTTMLYDLIEKKGWDFVRHVHGMFTIALYNEKDRMLRLYRDSGGQKPLYFTTIAPFAFSSELSPLVKLISSRAIDTEGLMMAGVLGYIPGSKTLFTSIEKVDAGEVVTVHEDGTLSRSYFSPLFDEPLEGNPKEVLEQVVTEHLQSKQKVALNLSGGLDSSVLLHEMKQAGHSLTTYTTAFDDAGESFNDDAAIAKLLARDYGTHHTEINISKEVYLDSFIRSYERLEEPNYNISLPTYLEVARREGISGDGNRVILSGNGGDEVFGGYRYYAESVRYQYLINRISAPLFNVGKWIRTGSYFNYGSPVDRWLAFKMFKLDGMHVDKQQALHYLKSIADARTLRLGDPVRDMMLLDRALWLAGESFMQADKLFMTHSLEVRAPLAYEPLRHYFDQRLTTKDYVSEGSNKALLRQTYKNLLPDYVIERKQKTGWRSPVRPWYAKDPRFKSLFVEILDGAKRGGMVNWDALRKVVLAHDTWPGKYMFLYLSLAILSKKYDIEL